MATVEPAINVAFSLVVGAAAAYFWDMTVDQNIAMLAQPFFGFQALSDAIAQPLIFISGTLYIFVLHWFAVSFPMFGLVPTLTVAGGFMMMTKYYIPSITYLVSNLTGGLVADVNKDISKVEQEAISWWDKRVKH